MTVNLTAAVLTVSDSSSQNKREDRSGPAIVNELTAAGFQVINTAIVPDEIQDIQEYLVRWCGQVRLVVTVGGTGLASRDITPEATRAVADRLVEGIAERMRAEGTKKTPMAVLSRGVCAVRGQALILNLPGSPTAAVESLQAVLAVVPHALDLLAGKTAHAEHP